MTLPTAHSLRASPVAEPPSDVVSMNRIKTPGRSDSRRREKESNPLHESNFEHVKASLHLTSIKKCAPDGTLQSRLERGRCGSSPPGSPASPPLPLIPKSDPPLPSLYFGSESTLCGRKLHAGFPRKSCFHCPPSSSSSLPSISVRE